jgi:hypothetical protein
MKSDIDYFPDQEQMWHLAKVQSLIIFICPFILAFAFKDKQPEISISFLMLGLTTGFNGSLLFFFEKTKPLNLSSSVYFFNVLITCVFVSLNHQYWIRMGLPFETFFGFKITAILVAMQAPSRRWVGWASMSLLLFAPLTQFFLWTEKQKHLVSIQEPWFTVLVITSAGFVYFQRLKLFDMVRKNAVVEAAEVELRRYAHLLLGAQHLINSPLQVIETAATLIQLQHPDTKPLVDKIQLSFEPIRHVSRLLSFGQKHLNWDDVSMALTVEELQKEVQSFSTEPQKKLLK